MLFLWVVEKSLLDDRSAQTKSPELYSSGSRCLCLMNYFNYLHVKPKQSGFFLVTKATLILKL